MKRAHQLAKSTMTFKGNNGLIIQQVKKVHTNMKRAHELVKSTMNVKGTKKII